MRKTETAAKEGGILLCVTDLATDSDDLLDAACELARTHGAHLEMIHVIDIEREKSHPDGQMGIQFRLETLARNLRRFRQSAASLLLFGTPEELIARRAKDMRAKLIAFAVTSPRQGLGEPRLIRQVARRVSCPVVVLPARPA